jgi:hypothetical protein
VTGKKKAAIARRLVTDALGLANIVTLDEATIEAFPSGVKKFQILPKGEL